MINWDAMQSANSKLSIHEHILVTKHVSRFASVGKNMKRRGEWKNSKCPRCGGIDETTHHIVLCPNVEDTHSYEDAVLQFEEKQHKMETYPSIINTMTLTLFGGENSKFKDNVEEDNEYETDSLHNIVRAAAKEQDNIGWHNFLEGKISTKWGIAQEQFYREDPKQRKCGKAWSSKVILYLYNIIKTQWMH